MADIASVRFSLPAHLLEPTPNLGMSPQPVLRVRDCNEYLADDW